MKLRRGRSIACLAILSAAVVGAAAGLLAASPHAGAPDARPFEQAARQAPGAAGNRCRAVGIDAVGADPRSGRRARPHARQRAVFCELSPVSDR